MVVCPLFFFKILSSLCLPYYIMYYPCLCNYHLIIDFDFMFISAQSESKHSDQRLKMLDWDMSECGTLSENGLGYRSHDLPSSAIFITIISVIICAVTVLILLITLCQMHRKGKLDRFL